MNIKPEVQAKPYIHNFRIPKDGNKRI